MSTGRRFVNFLCLFSTRLIPRVICVPSQKDSEIGLSHGITDVYVTMELTEADGTNGIEQDQERNNRILAAAESGNLEELRQALDVKSDKVNVPNSNGLSPLWLAVKKGSLPCVKLLVSRNADVNMINSTIRTLLQESWAPADDEWSLSPFLLACRLGHQSIVEFLFYKGADVLQTTPEDSFNCLNLAIMYDREETAKFLVTHTTHQTLLSLMKTWSPDLKLGRHRDEISTPMRQLIEYMPDVAEIVMDRCITLSENDEEVTCYVELLDDFYSSWAKKNKDRHEGVFDDSGHLTLEPQPKHTKIQNGRHPLELMQEQVRHAHLLTHPLSIKLIEHKWRTMGLALKLISLLVYCVFLVFLTGYVLVNPPAFYIKFSNKSTVIWYYDPHKLLPDETYSTTAKYLFGSRSAEFLLTLVVLNIVKEIFQMASQGRSYFRFENLLEWLIYVLTFLLVVNVSGATYETYELREKWQWQCGAIAIFLAWINLALYIRQTRTLGIYVIMFEVVLLSTFKFMAVILLFIVAFALAFNTLLLNQTDFHSFGDALLSTFAMSTGELEFVRIFHQQDYLGSINMTPEERFIVTSIFTDAITSITFVVFVITMPIIAMNLLIGVAVEDIHRIRQKARFYYMKLKVDQVISAENMVTMMFRTGLRIPYLRTRKCFIRRIPVAVQFLKVPLSQKPKLRTRLTSVVSFEEVREAVREICKKNQERQELRAQSSSCTHEDQIDSGSNQAVLQKLLRMRDEINGLISHIEYHDE